MGFLFPHITDVGAGEIYQCTVNFDGSFRDCPLATSITFDAPYGISFATVGGVQYAYVADAVTGVGPTGNINRCILSDTGLLTSCNTTPQQNTPSWVPYAITFASVGGTQYAYVADNGTSPTGHVYQCTLNSSNGLLDSCIPTPVIAPSSNWVPSDIAFATLNGIQYAYVANYQGVSLGGMYSCTLNSNGSFNVCTATPSSPPLNLATP